VTIERWDNGVIDHKHLYGRLRSLADEIRKYRADLNPEDAAQSSQAPLMQYVHLSDPLA
jgi:hypothetical protein